MRHVALLMIFVILSSSCASILNGKYQKVSIPTKGNEKLLVDGEDPKIKDGRILLKRDYKPKQITIKREGFKDEHHTLMANKKSPLYFISWVPFGMFFFPPLYDQGPKSRNYKKEIEIGQNVVALKKWDEGSKMIKLRHVAAELDADNIKFREFRTEKHHDRVQEKKASKTVDPDGEIKFSNTIFTDILNQTLKDKGYIDTTSRVFVNNFSNSLYIDAVIKDLNRTRVYFNIAHREYGGLTYVDLDVEWKVLNYYNEEMYTLTTSVTSDKLAFIKSTSEEKVLKEAIRDALEIGLGELINSKEVSDLLYDNTVQVMESSYADLVLPLSDKYVTNLSEAVNSSLTIKTKKGHGSGFLISSEGYIITNYHVVSDPENLEVVFNDSKKIKAEVVRVSKIHDLALLKIEATDLVPFRLSTERVFNIADEVFAVGTPTAEDLSQTVSRGIISGIRTLEGNSKLIQTDASINPGNSGGAIVNRSGLVQGVVSSKLSGFGIEGVAFGIPAYEIFDKLKIQIQ